MKKLIILMVMVAVAGVMAAAAFAQDVTQTSNNEISQTGIVQVGDSNTNSGNVTQSAEITSIQTNNGDSTEEEPVEPVEPTEPGAGEGEEPGEEMPGEGQEPVEEMPGEGEQPMEEMPGQDEEPVEPVEEEDDLDLLIEEFRSCLETVEDAEQAEVCSEQFEAGLRSLLMV